MSMDYEHSLIIKAVWCYYIEDMTQASHSRSIRDFPHCVLLSCWKKDGQKNSSSLKSEPTHISRQKLQINCRLVIH